MVSYKGFSKEQRLKMHEIFKAEIAAGRVPPANTQPCSICGQDKGIRHYHAEDYTNPELHQKSVRVVCWRCHMMIHNRFKHPLSVAQYLLNIHFLGKRYAPVYRPNDWATLEQHFTED